MAWYSVNMTSPRDSRPIAPSKGRRKRDTAPESQSRSPLDPLVAQPSQRFAVLAEVGHHSADIIVVIDRDAHVVYANPHPPDESLMLELRRRFKGEVVALSEYLGRDLVTLWGYDGLE